MYGSFYTAALGARSQQAKMDVISNNLANINTNGYKSKNAIFSDLVYTNLNANKEANTNLQAGSGIKISQVNTDFTPAGYTPTGLVNDFAIEGSGFFMLLDPATQETTYTRDGSFSLSLREDQFYLVSSNGKLVLDENRQAIVMSELGKDTNGNSPNIGIFEFKQKNGIESIGDNEFRPVEKNGQPELSSTSVLQQGVLEVSGVDVAAELSRVIETQRAYSYALKMVQTSDEITATINSLR
jgi:flagellar basal-body rod protein FlgG